MNHHNPIREGIGLSISGVGRLYYLGKIQFEFSLPTTCQNKLLIDKIIGVFDFHGTIKNEEKWQICNWLWGIEGLSKHESNGRTIKDKNW